MIRVNGGEEWQRTTRVVKWRTWERRRKVLADPLADSNYTETSSQIATPASSRVPFSSKRRGRQSNNTTQQVEITMQVKEEPISPGYENRSEDSDDPL